MNGVLARYGRGVLTAVSALGLAAAAVAVAPSAAGGQAATGAAHVAGAPVAHGKVARKTPAIGAHPHYRVAGRVTDSADPVFSCQKPAPGDLQCYGPKQIRAAYGVDKLAAHGLTGRGRTIVVVDAFASPTLRSDLAAFDKLFNLPDPVLRVVAPDGKTPFDPKDDNQVGWAGEITLDVEWSHAIAPKAKIVLVLAKTNDDADILSATRFAVDHNLGDVISQSFGEAEQCMDPTLLAAQHKLFAKAVAKRMTLLASSGDDGAAQPTCDNTSFFKAASTPASDPNVTGVGGTMLSANGLTGAYKSEQVWNEPTFESGGGGGLSVVYGAPGYQRAQHLRTRGVPDVSYNAAIDGGVLVVWGDGSLDPADQAVYIFGGTSSGSPQWAGLVALSAQLRHHRLGEINRALYALALAPRIYNTQFHDITVGNNTFHGPVTVPGFPARKGWDAASGLGSPKANAIVPALALIG
jgi:subtilase family serine protease